ncbi:hypothetical protein B566_EDAN006266 [Ephemera danica]|nr:hypothetical protein B566_EDAN006266 [Ephemera danica]
MKVEEGFRLLGTRLSAAMAPSANFVDLCRICATETQSIVRHFIFEGEGKLRDLSKKIAACLPVKVKEDDRLPKVLCGECVYKLDLLHEFREKSQKTEAYLFTLIDGPASDHHVRKQSSSQLRGAEEEDDDDSHGGGDNDGGHDIDDDDDELEPVTPAPVRRNAQGQICEPEVVIKVEEDNSKGDAAAASATSATPSAAAGAEDGGSPSKRPRRAAANKRPIREDSPSLEAPSSPPPPKRRGRKPKGVTPTSSAAAATSTATPGTSTSGLDTPRLENRELRFALCDSLSLHHIPH